MGVVGQGSEGHARGAVAGDQRLESSEMRSKDK